MENALLYAAADVREMGERVVANGAEVNYASEKMGFALFKAAEALALCGCDLDDALGQARRGFQRGEWLRGGSGE